MPEKAKLVTDLVLKKGREKSLLNRHPWVFSGAVQKFPDVENGEMVRVRDHSGKCLGVGFVSRKASISVRLIAFEDTSVKEAIEKNIESALSLRKGFFDAETTAWRLINGEGDGIPGLIVDKYGDVLVIQSGTIGIDKHKSLIIDILRDKLNPRVIYEKSNLPSRAEEELPMAEGYLYGEEVDSVEIKEYGLRYLVSLKESQKTGFFLDQREMRRLVGEFARGKTLLNCFSYTGGFSVSAAKGGAARVDSIDISKPAIERGQENFALNGLDISKHGFLVEDVFDYLRKSNSGYDFVILDPPAFAKKKAHVNNACKGYGEINRQGMKLVNRGGLLLTCSCSYYMDEKLFQQVLFQSARDAGRTVRILQRHRQAFDHPVSIYHPEGNYLKSFLLEVE